MSKGNSQQDALGLPSLPPSVSPSGWAKAYPGAANAISPQVNICFAYRVRREPQLHKYISEQSPATHLTEGQTRCREFLSLTPRLVKKAESHTDTG